MLITNGKLITWGVPNQILEGYALLIEGEMIKEVGPEKELKEKNPGVEVLDAKGQYIMPGNICAHTHFYGAFARGMAIPGSAPKDFPEILGKLWWPLDKSLTSADVKYSALMCLADAVRHGTTTLFDHHASPNAISGSLDEIAQAVEQAGVNASLCYEVTDRDGPEKSKAGIAENIRFIERVQRERPMNGRISALFGLHASLTLSEQTLDACRQACPDDAGFHIHVAEHSSDEYDSIAKSGLRVIDRLHKHHILGPKTIAVHGVHIDAREMQLLAENKTWLTHQPRSNMNNAVGISDVEAILRMGVRVGLGNDGFSNNMWEEWKTAYLVHKVWHHDPRWMNGMTVIDMAVYNNAELCNLHFPGKKFGVIEAGAQADLMFVDYLPYTPLSEGNLPWHILFGFRDSMVTTTIAAGKVLMRNRELLTLDEGKINFETQKLASNTWQRYQKLF